MKKEMFPKAIGVSKWLLSVGCSALFFEHPVAAFRNACLRFNPDAAGWPDSFDGFYTF
jgi:hypothetical protein